MIKCQICGFEGTMLGRHIRAKHNITPEEYFQQFPGAVLTDKSLREKMSNSNPNKGKTVGSLETRFGKEEADRIKNEIGSKSGASRLGKKRPQQGITVSKTWEARREEWSASIRAAITEELRQKRSDNQKAIIAERGYHLAYGKETALEAFVRMYFEQAGYSPQTQFRAEMVESTRFYDLFVPELNLLVECDGEFWHTREDRIAVDRVKNKWALKNGYSLLRISDADLPHRITHNMSTAQSNACSNTISNLLRMTPEDLFEHADHIVNRRLAALV